MPACVLADESYRPVSRRVLPNLQQEPDHSHGR